jgi:hypothetical protein
MKFLFVAIALLGSFLTPLSIVDRAAADNCQSVLGFKALHDLIPDVVGDCIADDHHNPVNGDALQETAGPTGSGGYGLLVWRKSDNWTAYTDGNRTWTYGPLGLQVRLNSERFSWEVNPPPEVATAPVPTPTLPPATPAKYSEDELIQLLQNRTPDQVVQLIGPPDDRYGSGAVEFWLYSAISYNPITNQVDLTALVTFYNGVADSVTF